MSAASPEEPTASLPDLPGYESMSGYGHLLPWQWAVERLERAHNYWLATTRPDGRPHVMPVWGVWHANGFYFSTGDRSRKARNLAANAACVVCPEDARDGAVVLEATAVVVDDGAERSVVVGAYEQKYGWRLDSSTGPVYRASPTQVFGITEDGQAGGPTRWRFADGALSR